MNRVYIYDANGNNTFTSLLMNDLSNLRIPFNNMRTTKVINSNNILIYIPRVGIGTLEFADMVREIDSVSGMESHLLSFRRKIIPLIEQSDFSNIRSLFNMYYNDRYFNYYQSNSFSTLYSSIIANDCLRMIKAFRKFHNKQ